MATQICLYCGNTFLPQRKSAKYCSGKCRTAYHRLLKRAGQHTDEAFWCLTRMQRIIGKFPELAPTIDKLMGEVRSEVERLRSRTWQCPSCGQSVFLIHQPDICLKCGTAYQRWVLIGNARR